MMKKITFYNSLIVVAILLISACTKDDKLKATYQINNGGAYFRLIHAAPSFRLVYSQPDSFHVFINGAKINGPFLTYNANFPAAASINGYAAVQAGTQPVKFSVAGTVNPDSIAIVTFNSTFTAGEWYTMLITDSARVLLTDSYTKPAAGSYGIRFINAVMNDTAGKAVDVFSIRANANIFTNIKPGVTATPFQAGSYNSLNDTLYVRRAGTTFNLAVLNNQAFAHQRAYTLYYKGNGSLATGTKARALAAYLHP